MFFDAWETVGRVLLSGLVIYVLIVIMLRISGKRTLSKWNAFDFIVTIALGSMMATIVLSKETTIMQGGAAVAALILFQAIVTAVAVRVTWFRRVIKGRPTLLFRKGEFLQDVMKRSRVTESEILAAIRENGIGEVTDVDAVVLENDGSFSVIGTLRGEGEALRDVNGWQWTKR